MDASLDVFCSIDEAGKFVYVSAASTEHWGYSPEELTGKPYRDLIIEEDHEKTDGVAAEIMSGKDFKSFHNRFRKKDGDIAYNLWSARWDHEANLMYCVARDAKEKIEEEQRLKLLEKVINSTSDAILITEAEPLDEPGPVIVYANEAFTRMTGYTSEEVIGKNPRILQGPDSDFKELRKLGEKLRRWESSEITVLNYTKSGEPFWVNFAVSPVANEKGWFTHWISVQRDVTEQKKQQAEKELLSQISLSFNDGEGLIPAANRLCEDLYDFGKFDLIELWCPNMERTQLKLMGRSTHSQDFYELEASETSFQRTDGLQGRVWEKGKQLLWDKKQINKYFVRKKGASHFGLQAILGIPLTFNEELVGVLLIGTNQEKDYLDQHSAVLSRLEKFIGSEINRKRLENNLRNVYDAIPEILCIIDFEGRFLKINNAGCALLGYTNEELLYHSLDEFALNEDKGKFEQKINGITKEASFFTFENRFLTKDGHLIWLSWNCNTALEEGLVYASAKNISTEVQLRELNAQAGSLAKIGSWEIDLEKNTVFWSKIVHQLHETDADTFSPNFENTFNFYREDFRPLVQRNFENASTTGEGFDFEAVITTQKLKERWVRVIGNVEFVDGTAYRIYGSFQDITDRKESEIRLEAFTNNLPGVAFQYFIYFDGTDDLKYVTDGAQAVWGFDADSVMKENSLVWKQIELGGEMEVVNNSIQKSLETQSEWKAQWRYITPGNELRIHLGYGSPSYLPDDTVVFNSLIFDITEEYRSEELLTQASEMAKIGSWELNLMDQENDSMYWSPMTRKILEVDDSYNPSLTGGFEFYGAEDIEEIQRAVNVLIETGQVFDLELLITTPSGKAKWIRCIGRADFIDGTCARIYGSFQDIHDRKVFEVALRESEANFRTIFEIASLGIVQASPADGRILFANSYFEEILGYSHEELLQMRFLDLTHPDDRERDWDLFKKAARGEIEYRNEKRHIRKDGSTIWTRIHLAFIRDEGGNPIKTVAICENITDRKEIESQFKNLSDNLPGVVFQYLLFPDGTDSLRSVSKGSYQLWGYSPEEVEQDINLVWDQTKAGGDYEKVKKEIAKAVQTKSKWFSQYRSVLPSGEVLMHLGSGTPSFLADGTVQFDSFVMDITRESKNEELLSEAIQMARIGSWEVNFHNHKILWSDITHQLHETDPASFIPDLETSINFYREDFREKVQSRVKACVENGTPFDFEAIIVTAKNNERWVRAIGQAEMINGECKRIHGSFQDIHDRKIAEIQLKSLTDNLPGVIFQYLLQPDGKDQILYISEGSYKVWGLSPEECKLSPGKVWQQIEAGGYKEEVVNSILESAQNLTPWLAEWKNLSSDGTVKWYEGRGLPQRLSDGAVLWNSLIIDITEKKEFEEKYQRALAERATILESISDAFYALDGNWNFTYFNREAENLLKKNSQEVLGENLWEIFSPAKGTLLEEVYRRVASSGESESFEYHYPGDGCWYEITTYPSAGGVASYFKNIDERRKAAQELERAYREKDEILESIGDAFFAVDEKWTVTYWNQQAESILGKAKDDTLGKNLWEEFPDAIDTDFYRQYHLAMETGETVNFEEYYPTLDIWVEVTVYPSEIGLSIYFKDITLRKAADIRLLEANERFEIITRATNDAIWDYNIVENTLFWGDGFKTLFGYEVDRISPTLESWTSHIHPDDREQVEKSVVEAIEDKDVTTWQEEYRYKKADGTFAFVYDKGMILRNQTGKAVRMLGAMSDFTQLKKQELELLEINESLKTYAKELERSNEELEQFAFVTSHDLQEPLRMISSFMDQLKRKYTDQLDDRAQQYIHFAIDGAKRMKQIILDLLLYSRANRPEEQVELINLNEIVSEYTQLRRKLIAEKKAVISYEGLPVLQTYRAPMTHIIHCLLDNALKYSKDQVPPQIEIHATKKRSLWEFAIKDNGIGIDKRFYNKVFVIFQRLHNRNQYDGTGIGLSIARRSVEFLGGTIWLESKVGEGSTFYFTIPKK